MNRVHVVKTILWALVGLGLAVAISRFAFGLGATTNLTDATPWGLWIGFDVMAGVALAAGGFVITAVFYMMRRKEFHPMVRPAVLTAFLGYVAVVFSLLVDLGLPWNIWHMMIYWNPHSPLFEVGWCVMLYTTVLLLEFSPVPLESTSRYAKIRTFLMKFRFPLVLLGIMLSTLHQSSLGSLFLIMPFKLHPLWYTKILPILFFISAVGLGLMMVSFESLVSGWIYRKKPETHLVAKLGKAAVWVLGVFLIVRFVDLGIAGKLGLIFAGSWESFLFVAEILIMAVIPMIIFANPATRNRVGWQWAGSFMVVFGAVFNRINVGGLTMVSTTGDAYFPSWMEFAISFGVVSFMILIFLFAIEKFHIWEEQPRELEADPHAKPRFSRAGEVWLGAPAVAGRTKYSFAFVLALAIGFAIMPGKKLHSGGIENVPVEAARGGDTLYVDGNRDGYGVAFKHEFHIDTLGGDQSCVRCHHMNMPMDFASGCFNCHSQMYQAVDAFKHDWHASPSGGNVACNECHAEGENRTAASAKSCESCHTDLIPAGATIEIESYMAPAYTDAMHDMCIGCHREVNQQRAELPEQKDLALCGTCHTTAGPEYLRADVRERLKRPEFNRVVMPGLSLEDGK
ncbi:Ni/Fe-hydrogenase cytochrome b subunit [candidate division GN15 bacterium]|nr:Ni/Fe-hydrogenase cytochrome b subunit [candidate division GN15 bacterium]